MKVRGFLYLVLFGLHLYITFSHKLSTQSLMETLFFYLKDWVIYLSVFKVVTNPVFNSKFC